MHHPVEPLTKSYPLRLPESIYCNLKHEARNQGTSVNSLINALIAAGLEHEVEVTYRLVDNKQAGSRR